ncbi:MAG: serine protease [Planctomycetota bacterium]
MPKNVEAHLEGLRRAALDYDAARVADLAESLVSDLRDRVAENPKAFVRELARACDAFDRGRVAELCQQLVEHLRVRARPYPLAESKKLLDSLRRKRHFEELACVADVLVQTGQDAPRVRRQYAQALIDLGRLTAGFDVLVALEADCKRLKDEGELAEARGLMGRAKKQMYIDAAASGRPGAAVRESLGEAIGHYAGEYRRDRGRIWHGINAVALLDRARRDKIRLGRGALDAERTARSLLRTIQASEEPDLWAFATAAEASLALGDYGAALEWTVRYTSVEGSHADAFELASTLRQFEEVWQLSGADRDQARILNLLRSALLAKEGGQVEVQAPRADLQLARERETDGTLEKVLGADRYKTLRWYEDGLRCARAVAQVVDLGGNGQGTGFALRGDDVHASLAGCWVLLTNAHVLSDDPAEQRGTPAALAPDEARVRFENSEESDREFPVEELVFTSPREELDCTIVKLPPDAPVVERLELSRGLPLVGKARRVYVIGHPRGGRLSFSLHDNLLLDHEKPWVHYRAPTEGGSSGSPVFNDTWRLIALHHSGGLDLRRLRGKTGTYAANEGIAIQSILAAVRAELG